MTVYPTIRFTILSKTIIGAVYWSSLFRKYLKCSEKITESSKSQVHKCRVGERDGVRTLYTVRIDSNTFAKAHQYSSFRKDIVKRQTRRVPDIAERIVEREVKVISFDTLLQEAEGREIDIINIDTEGYDYEILKMIDLNKIQPSLILYEHCNLNKAEMSGAAELLIAHGYRLARDNLDTIAYRPLVTYGFRL